MPSLISGILLSCVSWFIESPYINLFSKKSILAVFYLGDFSGICGILSYFYLQKRVSSFYASTVFLIFPFVAGILDKYAYKKTISLNELFYILLLFLGILLTLIPKSFFKNIIRYLK